MTWGCKQSILGTVLYLLLSNLSSATFSVSTRDHALLSDFNADGVSIKEYSVNISSGDLEITFTPSGSSFAFLNGLKVVSIPDQLIGDDASSVNPPTDFHGLVYKAFEIVFRVNMGGPMVTSRNDSLWRTWLPDRTFLKNPDVATNKSKLAAVKYPSGGATLDNAPRSVYGTVAKMASESDPKSNFNVTWEFPVDHRFRYLLRFHFCDIVSTAPNQLYFNVYVDDSSILSDLDLYSKFNGNLANAYYVDFVTLILDKKNQIRISVGPSTIKDAYPNAILNGL